MTAATITVRRRRFQEQPEPLALLETTHPCHACDAQDFCDEARQASRELLGRHQTCVTRRTVYREIENGN